LANGQIVLAKIEQQRDILGHWIPQSALTEGLRGTWQVFLVADNNGEFQLQKVAVSPHYYHRDQVFIGSSDFLPAQSRIVADGTQRLSNFQTVEIQ
jgi:multidrug efflux pump subunit AcrA (membrane-fusion protein)